MNPKDAQVEVTGSTLIRSGVAGGQIALAPLDWINSSDFPSQIFLYRDSLDPARLKTSLAEVLRAFPIFSGRSVVASDALPVVALSDDGVRFTEQHSPLSIIEARRRCEQTGEAGDYAQKVAPFKNASGDTPLLSITLTQFEGGGSALGITHFHGVCDGGGMFHFLSSWSKCLNGAPFTVPVFDRSVIRRLQQGHQGEVPSAHDSFPGVSLVELMQMFVQVKAMAQRSTRQVVHFSADRLKNMKRDALRRGGSPQTWFSTQDLLVAHVWREVVLAQDQPVPLRLSCILDLRKRHGFEVPDEFIGNAHTMRSGEARDSQWQESELVALAQRVREVSDAADPVSVGQDVAYLARQIPGAKKIHVSELALRPSQNLTINNLCTLPCYDIDLGAGNPVWYVPPDYPGSRIVHVAPSAARDGGFDVHIKLDRAEMERLLDRHRAAAA